MSPVEPQQGAAVMETGDVILNWFSAEEGIDKT